MSVSVIVAYAKDNLDKATIGLTLANAALDDGEAVSVIFASEGVRLTVVGYTDDMDNGQPFKPVQTLLDEILAKGGRLHVCTPCMKKRGIGEDQILRHERLRFITGADLIRVVRSTDRTIQL
jgi:predicted peroxiredoxin